MNRKTMWIALALAVAAAGAFASARRKSRTTAVSTGRSAAARAEPAQTGLAGTRQATRPAGPWAQDENTG
jgi:hypothetical protein